jgi:hypothetical protein
MFLLFGQQRPGGPRLFPGYSFRGALARAEMLIDLLA